MLQLRGRDTGEKADAFVAELKKFWTKEDVKLSWLADFTSPDVVSKAVARVTADVPE